MKDISFSRRYVFLSMSLCSALQKSKGCDRMQDGFRREINYLRVSVTDRCNLRCVYCMPSRGVKLLPHGEILRNEEIETIVRAAALVGIRKVRLTGGEPLVRRGLVELVRAIFSIPEIDDLALSTNGILLAENAALLKEAGLKRVNISLDTLKPDRYRSITRYGDFSAVWRGINAALEVGLHPVKLNTVVMRGLNDDEVVDMARLTLDYPLHVRFIELMSIGTASPWASENYVSSAEIAGLISRELGDLEEVRKPTGSGPARYYRLPSARGTVGFISAVSDHFCSTCNRLRLTARGGLRPCLFDDREIDIKTPLRKGATLEEIAGLFRLAVRSKPVGQDAVDRWNEEAGGMSKIGG